MGQHHRLLDGLVQDAEYHHPVNVGQAVLEVVVVLDEVLLVNSDALPLFPAEGAGADGYVLEHGLFAAGLKPGLVEHQAGPVREGQQRGGARLHKAQLQRQVVHALGIAYIQEAQLAAHFAGGNAVARHHGLQGETGVLAGEGVPVVPRDALVEIQREALAVIVVGPAGGQVGDDFPVVVGIGLHQVVVGGSPVAHRHAGESAPGVGVLQRVLVVDAQRAAVHRIAVVIGGRVPVF